MNGVHDLGGMHGFGPIDPEPEELEPVFHEKWEARVFAMNLACGALGRWSIDESRYSRERIEPVRYLASSYFEKWLLGLRSLLLEKGILGAEELDSGMAATPSASELTDRRLSAKRVASARLKGKSSEMECATGPRFTRGDRVRVRPNGTAGHTRAVRYATGRFGTIETHHGCHVFPDRSAAGERVGEHLYGVVFTAQELWGEAGSSSDRVHVDLWEPYLELWS